MNIREFYVDKTANFVENAEAFAKASEMLSVLYNNRNVIYDTAKELGFELSETHLELADGEGVGGPTFTDKVISFNGVGEDACEDFFFTPNPNFQSWYYKTRYNNYGNWVLFAQAVIDAYLPYHFKFGNDGDLDEADSALNVLKCAISKLGLKIDTSRMNEFSRASVFISQRYLEANQMVGIFEGVEREREHLLLDSKKWAEIAKLAEAMAMSKTLEQIQSTLDSTTDEHELDVCEFALEIYEEHQQHLADLHRYYPTQMRDFENEAGYERNLINELEAA